MEEISREIIHLASLGDVDAFKKIYDNFSGYVYNVSLRIVCNREDAQEVVQNVFMKVYSKLKDFQYRATLATWIYRTTVNTAINYAKKQSKFKKHIYEYNDLLIYKDEQSNVIESIEVENKKEIIDRLMKMLTPEQRACIVLRNLEGLSYQEIAETLNIKLNAVRSRIKRARWKLLLAKKEVVSNEM